MASTVIHMAVASEVNKVLKRNNDILLIGSIAPDISKQVGETKLYSHFLNSLEEGIPNIERFLDKYKKHLNDDFVMGYFIHLYTDYLWAKFFLPEFINGDYITKLDGSTFKCEGNMAHLYIYNDYTNLNTRLLDEYNMDLNIFYNEVPEIKHIIDEIDMNELHVIIDKASIIIENSKEKKDLVFNMDNINKFIETSVKLILAKIEEIQV